MTSEENFVVGHAADPLLEDLERAVKAHGGASRGSENISLLTRELIANPAFASEVSEAVQGGKSGRGWGELVAVVAALGVFASAQVLYQLVAADQAGSLRELGKLFGHSNVGTFN
jgi:hypothetical protein